MKVSILFVCLGNICRSPAAETILKKKVREQCPWLDCVIASAGIGSWHVGELPDNRMRRHGAKRGYDISSRAWQVTHADIRRYDYVIAMDNDNARALDRLVGGGKDKEKIRLATDFMTQHPQHTSVPDPYYGDDSDFELALDLIEDVCDGIIQQLTGNNARL